MGLVSWYQKLGFFCETLFGNLHVDPLSFIIQWKANIEFNPYVYTVSKLSRFGYEICFNTQRYSEQPPEPPSDTSYERLQGRMDFQKTVEVWIYKYIFNGLASLLNCKDSTNNKILIKPYPGKEKKETSVHYFSSVLWNIRRIPHYKTSVHWNIRHML